MNALPYTTKAGVKQFRPECSSDEVEAGGGFCLACGADGQMAEPDARKYVCDRCGKPKVYGLEELVLMGLVRFTAEDK